MPDSKSLKNDKATFWGQRRIFVTFACSSIVFVISLWVIIGADGGGIVTADPAGIITVLSVVYLVSVILFGTYRAAKAFEKSPSRSTKGAEQKGGEGGQSSG